MGKGRVVKLRNFWKYNKGDIVEYDGRNFLVVDVIDGPYMPIYKMLNMGTNNIHNWFTIDIDINSRLMA